MVAVAAIMGGIVLNAYSGYNGEESNNGFAPWINDRMMARTNGWSHRWQRGCGCFRFLEVSEEFEENVIDIAKSDQDVLDLLDDGYNITGVRPIIKAVVDADGNVETRATSAIALLEKDESSHASVWVDLEEARVTRIVIISRTVIEKP